METNDFAVIFVNNLKILNADFDYLKLPRDPSQIRNTFLSFPKPALARLFGFLLSKLDNQRFEKLIKPLLIRYCRAVDNQLKNHLWMWIRDFPIELGLSISFSRVWSCPCPEKSCKFFATLSTYVLENLIKSDPCNNLGVNGAISEKLEKFLRNICLLRSNSRALEELTPAEQAFAVGGDSQILAECLEYAKLEKSKDDILGDLSLLQMKRLEELLNLKKSFSLQYREWLSMRPLFLAMSVFSGASPTIQAKDLCGSADSTSDPENLVTLSQLIKQTGDLFTSITNSLSRPDRTSDYSQAQPLPELSWCSRSLRRVTETSEFNMQKKLPADTQALSSRLDVILAALRELLERENKSMSISMDRSFRTPFDFGLDNSVDCKVKLASPASPSIDSSPSSKSHPEQCFSCVTPFELFERRTGEINKISKELPLRSMVSEATNITGFVTNDELFHNINDQLAALLETTTLHNHPDFTKSQGAEEDVQSGALQKVGVGVPPIQPPLLPLRLSSGRASLKSLRFSTPATSERSINQNEEVDMSVSKKRSSPHFQSFTEFSNAENLSADTSSWLLRSPLRPIDTNAEDRRGTALLPSLAIPLPNSNSGMVHGQDGTKIENDAGPDDESLGLLSFEDMSDSASKLLFSP